MPGIGPTSMPSARSRTPAELLAPAASERVTRNSVHCCSFTTTLRYSTGFEFVIVQVSDCDVLRSVSTAIVPADELPIGSIAATTSLHRMSPVGPEMDCQFVRAYCEM